jgi:Glycosyl hydrolases family 35
MSVHTPTDRHGILSRKICPSLLIAFGFAVVAIAHAAENDRTFAHSNRIRYDSRCLTIDGQDTFIFSGAFHYFRCPKELWRDRFAKIKEAGFNTVETYVAWNVHEPDMPSGLDDFSKVDLRDIDEWLNLAEEFGFYVIVRPGPYICAEWDRGGFPGWLVTKRPTQPKEAQQWLRSDDPEFIAWSKHWYDAVCPLLVKHQITHKQPGQPGIILFQLENEYDYSALPKPVKMAYVKALAEAANANGIDVPMITCWTKDIRGNQDPVLRQVFDSCNFYPGWKVDDTVRDIRQLRSAQPDAPLMTTELQGGWFTNVGTEPPIRPTTDNYRDDLTGNQIANLTLLALQNGETITNYYMLFGGTNFGDSAAQWVATSYDYSSPIRECGGVGDKYLCVKAIGQMLKEHGTNLTRADAVDAETSTGYDDVTAVERRASDGSRYIFVRTNQHDQSRSGSIRIKPKVGDSTELVFNYELKPFGSKVLYLPPGVSDPAQGEWLPKVLPPLIRPTNVPDGVKITKVLLRSDPLPKEWKSAASGAHLSDLAIFDSRFVYYRATIAITDEELSSPGGIYLCADHSPEDRVAAMINGQPLLPAVNTGTSSFEAQSALHSGENELLLVYENLGNPNGGNGIEKRAGVTAIRLTAGETGLRTIDGWRMHLAEQRLPPEKRPDIAADVEDKDWPAVDTAQVDAAQLQPRQTAVFRGDLEISGTDLKRGKAALAFSRIDDDGWIFVNGQKIGDTREWNRSYRFDAAQALHPGHNVVAVVVRNREGMGGLGPVALALADAPIVGKVGQLYYSDQPAYEAAEWSREDLPDASWRTENLPEVPTRSVSLLSWHRLAFELPAPDSSVWVPWLIRLHTNGNGFVYVNGHPLGRYWQSGKQSDFYLPECWLHFGAGKKNVVTLCLRQVDTPIAFESAEVLPYEVYAEQR